MIDGNDDEHADTNGDADADADAYDAVADANDGDVGEHVDGKVV